MWGQAQPLPAARRWGARPRSALCPRPDSGKTPGMRGWPCPQSGYSLKGWEALGPACVSRTCAVKLWPRRKQLPPWERRSGKPLQFLDRGGDGPTSQLPGLAKALGLVCGCRGGRCHTTPSRPYQCSLDGSPVTLAQPLGSCSAAPQPARLCCPPQPLVPTWGPGPKWGSFE